MREDLGLAAAEFPDDLGTPRRHLSSIEAFPAIGQEPVARLATEIFAPVDGGPGTLARALAAITAAGCNIAGEAEVVVLAVVNRPGIAERVFRLIANAEINVAFSYLGTENHLVIGTNNSVEAARLLNA